MRQRGALAAQVLGLLGRCPGAGWLASRMPVGRRHVELGLIELRLTSNTGAAFSSSAGLPDELLLAVTAVITLAVGGYTLRQALSAPWATRPGLASSAVSQRTN